MQKGKAKSSTSKSTAMNLQVLAAAIADFEVKIYGGNGKPLYDLVTIYGEVALINNLKTAFDSYAEIKENLALGECAVNYSSEYEHYTVAIRVPDGICFATLLHDSEGQPRIDETLLMCRVMANRDFELDGDTIIRKGDEFLKALPESYALGLKKAA